MRPPRLSYQTAGAADRPRVERAAPGRVTAVGAPEVPTAAGFGRSPGQARQRRVVIAALLATHALGVVGLLNPSRLRDAVVEAKPMFLSVVAAPATSAPPKPLPPPPATKAPLPPPLALPLIVAEAAPSPSPLVAQVAPPPPPMAVAPAEAAAPVPAPSPPRTIPPSAVQYLVPPAPVYSRASARMRESGKALVRVYIDEDGLPRNVQLAASTGFSRLDEAALAAVRGSRFKPYFENGVAVAGWAAIPIEFELPA